MLGLLKYYNLSWKLSKTFDTTSRYIMDPVISSRITLICMLREFHGFICHFGGIWDILSLLWTQNFKYGAEKAQVSSISSTKNIWFCKTFSKVFPNEFLDSQCHPRRFRLNFREKSWFFGFFDLILPYFWLIVGPQFSKNT